MLVLNRRRGETIKIGDGPNAITIMLVEIKGNGARIGIEAPKYVPIYRTELLQEKKEQDT